MGVSILFRLICVRFYLFFFFYMFSKTSFIMIFDSEKYICSSLRAGGLDLVCLITKATSLLLGHLTLHKLR